MGSRFIEIDHRQALLLPPDLRDWVPSDDLVHFVIETVWGMDLSAFRVNERGTGSAQYSPHMMLALLIYCYANGIFSSRKIERATFRDVSVRYLTCDRHPDHDTICKFRRENFDAVAQCFVRVLELARELKLLKVGTVSVDGSKIKANANKKRSVRYDRAGQLVEQLKLEVAELMDKAEHADRGKKDEGDRLPSELARREVLQSKLAAARARIESRSKARADAERSEYEKKVKARNQRQGRRKGPRPKPPDEKPKDKDQDNLTDPDSRLMRKSKHSAYMQAYNAQAVVDADGSYLILGARVSQCASDRNELVQDMETIPGSLGSPQTVLADNGYLNEDQVKKLEGGDAGSGMEVLVSVHAEAKQLRRRHDFRPLPEKPKEPPAIGSEFVSGMKQKMDTEAARNKYRLRMQTVEPVFGTVKKWMGFDQFLLRGIDKVTGEWNLVALAYNFKRLWKAQCTLSAAA
jgi:transposase